ncbi:hypothetical protein QZH41_014816 [Actinostola sp. cb2023]|nr:hypothetical protein QZH41_014816 [Actinostola sp. cb2023]
MWNSCVFRKAQIPERRGTIVTLSIQFRSKVADPTLKFQKFLRPSERIVSISIDSPVSRTMCSFPCHRLGNQYCHSWSYYAHHGYNKGMYNTVYQNTGYQNTGIANTAYQQPSYTGYDNTGYQQCPSTCAQYSYSNCPPYCTPSCCTQTYITIPTAIQPTQASPTATKPPTKAKVVVPTAVVHTAAPTNTATKSPAPPHWGGYLPYRPHNQCGTCLFNSPYCYAYCDENCCKHKNDVRSLMSIVADVRKHLKKFEAIVKYGKSADLPEFVGSKLEGNAAPIFGNKAKLAVKMLRRNIAKLEAKIKIGQNKFKGENLDDLLFEKAIKKAEKHSREKNVLPDFEQELEDLENDINVLEFGNSSMTSDDLEKIAENDMEKFDLDEDEENQYSSKADSGITSNRSTSNYDMEKVHVRKENHYNERLSSSRNGYDGPTHNPASEESSPVPSSKSDGGPTTNVSMEHYYKKDQARIDNNYPSMKTDSGPTTNVSMEHYYKKDQARIDNNYPSMKTDSGPTTNVSMEHYYKKDQARVDNNYPSMKTDSGPTTTPTTGYYNKNDQARVDNNYPSMKTDNGPTTNVSMEHYYKKDQARVDNNYPSMKTDSGTTTNVSMEHYYKKDQARVDNNYPSMKTDSGPTTNVSMEHYYKKDQARVDNNYPSMKTDSGPTTTPTTGYYNKNDQARVDNNYPSMKTDNGPTTNVSMEHYYKKDQQLPIHED